MALPFDQLLRRERFIKEHPAWSICPQDGGVRFTAERTEGKNSHVIAGLSLGKLLDRLEEIEAGQ
jgi:hypothetical protein